VTGRWAKSARPRTRPRMCAREARALDTIRAMSDPFALPAFIVALVGLIIAVIGALTGIASLWWQIVTRRRGAHNVRVSVSSSLPVPAYGEVPDWQACISPANIGAAPVSITGWGLEMPDKRGSLVQTKFSPFSQALPHLLQPGTSINLFWPQDEVRLAIAKHAPDLKASELRAFVHLGTGEKVYAKKPGVPV
jgi:hypothetical protein